jgi:hypothetical protein
MAMGMDSPTAGTSPYTGGAGWTTPALDGGSSLRRTARNNLRRVQPGMGSPGGLLAGNDDGPHAAVNGTDVPPNSWSLHTFFFRMRTRKRSCGAAVGAVRARSYVEWSL